MSSGNDGSRSNFQAFKAGVAGEAIKGAEEKKYSKYRPGMPASLEHGRRDNPVNTNSNRSASPRPDT